MSEHGILCRLWRTAVLAAVAAALSGCGGLSSDFSDAEVGSFTGSITQDLAAQTPPFSGVLDADAAVQRALDFNYALKVKELEAEVAAARIRVAAGALLPDILADSNYYRRDRRSLSRSNASAGYSTSSDLATLTNSIATSWNILDFGLNLVRTRQSEDRARWQAEDARRVAARVVEDTRTTYWRAVALHALIPKLDALDAEVGRALDLSRRAISDPEIDPADFIEFQRDTLNLRRELNDIFNQVAGADFQLKEQTAISQSAPLALVSERSLEALILPRRPAGDDIARALVQRPEVRQAMYDLRINNEEVDAAILEVLPGAVLSQTLNTDSNSFLLHGNWVSWSARITANLINIVRLPDKLDALEAETTVNRQKAVATAAAIAMQVHVARAKVGVQMRSYRDAQQFADNQRQILRQIRNSVRAGKLGEQLLAQEEVSALLAEVRAILAFGELHGAIAAYESALGEPLRAEMAQVPWHFATQVQAP